MTIQFKYTNPHFDEYGSGVNLSVDTQAEELGGVVETFKTFLSHCGYHPASIERVLYVAGDNQGFQRGDGNPYQGDFFDDTEDYQSDGTDEESGV